MPSVRTLDFKSSYQVTMGIPDYNFGRRGYSRGSPAGRGEGRAHQDLPPDAEAVPGNHSTVLEWDIKHLIGVDRISGRILGVWRYIRPGYRALSYTQFAIRPDIRFIPYLVQMYINK